MHKSAHQLAETKDPIRPRAVSDSFFIKKYFSQLAKLDKMAFAKALERKVGTAFPTWRFLSERVP
jgi:hypothetical protein